MGLFDKFRSIFGHDASLEGAETPEEEGTPLSERRAAPRSNPREGTRILVIDDSHTVIVILKRFLQSTGCVVLEALDAKIGLEIALTQKPELIFLDIVMPGINGFAALRALRRNANTQHIPVIMMSGNEQATAQFFGINIGADDFMKKPFSRTEVFARIERFLDADGVPRRLPETRIDAMPPPGAATFFTPPSPVEGVSPPAQTPAVPLPPPTADHIQFQRIPPVVPSVLMQPPAAPAAPEPVPEPPWTISPLSVESSPPVPPSPAPIPATPTHAPAVSPDAREHVPELTTTLTQAELLTQIVKWSTLALSNPNAMKTLTPLMSQLLRQVEEKNARAQATSGVDATPLRVL
ncbi:MAG: response regulator [Zoogloeaceae bacterium]|jgi:twitching motility two-component system response regulator PilH|nr:response regulator [Zoogloeaceae bacterium]